GNLVSWRRVKLELTGGDRSFEPQGDICRAGRAGRRHAFHPLQGAELPFDLRYQRVELRLWHGGHELIGKSVTRRAFLLEDSHDVGGTLFKLDICRRGLRRLRDRGGGSHQEQGGGKSATHGHSPFNSRSLASAV